MTGVRGGVGFGCYLRAEAVKLLSHRAIMVVALLSLATGISITWFDTPVVVKHMQEGSRLKKASVQILIMLEMVTNLRKFVAVMENLI